ncbi:MAG TPA: YdcF family protein [Stellaceae bacterium]|nr:YdcF family protein [Stellaceae bacterium]
MLLLAALPVVAARMLEDVEVKPPPDKPDFSAAQAIVVLGGGVNRGDGNKAPDTLGPWSLERLDFAAHAYRQLNLKIAVSGGRPPGTHNAEATLMKAALEDDFAVPVSWVENQSRTTWENALYTKELLQADGITTVVLVTNAWHMRRAVWSFERVGLHAIPYPAPLTYQEADRVEDYLPSMHALEDSYHALHEAIGLAYYRLRY